MSIIKPRFWSGLSDIRWQRGIPTLIGALLGLCVAFSTDTLEAQLPAEAIGELPLIDQQPFDVITLTESAGGESVRVLPIPFPNRTVPSNVDETDEIEVIIEKFPERTYEIQWRNIARIDLYEQMIYDQAVASLQNKDFVTAFQNLSFLNKKYPQMPDLEKLRREFLFRSAASMFSSGKLRQTLSTLEELKQSAPGYQARRVDTGLSNVADQLIETYQQSGDLGSAKELLNRLEKAYGTTLKVVSRWRQRLQSMALAKRKEAEQLMRQERFREARRAAKEMLAIYPDLPDGEQLLEEINRVHPMVRVGVMQRASSLQPNSLLNWPARRAGNLVFQPLFQFLETGSEGGKYGFALGSYRLSDDRQKLILSLDQSIDSEIEAFQLAQELLNRATPGHGRYDPSWAAIFKSVSASSASQVTVSLKRPNVLPHALLQWFQFGAPDSQKGIAESSQFQSPQSMQAMDMGGTATSQPILGPYTAHGGDETERSFRLRTGQQLSGRPVEIIEVYYDDPQLAVNDLLRGEIDVLDQLYPIDAKRLASGNRVTVNSYALPSVHMLLPVSDHPYLENTKFRRSLLYATDRRSILRGELLNSELLEDGRLVSGPFPLGGGEADPLAYAYNKEVTPTEYNPQLSKLLLTMTTNELRAKAEDSGEEFPELTPLRIGCPDFEVSRVAVQAMIQQWNLVGIDAEMTVFPPGVAIDESANCDLIYVTAMMWEPATDIERLLGENAPAASDNPFIIQGLQHLRAARNWREIRQALQDLHRLVDYHLPILPLWQIADRFAYAPSVIGLEDRPVSLYQNILQWRIRTRVGGADRIGNWLRSPPPYIAAQPVITPPRHK